MEEIKAKSARRINEKTLLVTVDIRANVHWGYLRRPDRSEMKPFQFSNDRAGFEQFWKRIEESQAHRPLERVVIGFESTSVYGEPLVHFLKDRPVELVQVNPMHTKRMKELEGNSPNKTDRKDPRVIANVIELGHFLTVIVPEGSAAELRRLSQARERAVERQGRLENQLHALMLLLFPEFWRIMKGVRSKTARYLLDRYPRPQDLLDLGLEALAAALKKVSQGKLGRTRAQALLQAAALSVGLQQGQESILFEVQQLRREWKTNDESIQQAEKKMRSYLDQVPYSHSILSIKGIGVITAAGLIGEVGDFRKFRTIAEVLKLAGLDLYENQSGNHQGQRHISKRGRSFLRKLLYFAAISTVRKGGIFQVPYQRYVATGMAKPKALIAIARKLLGLIVALVREHRQYQLDYEPAARFRLAA